jgi:hypothetical protein
MKSQIPPKYKAVGVSDLGDPQPSRPVNLSLRAPAQMGWRKMEHKGECGLYYLAPEDARSRGYKRREREREPVRLLVPRATPPPTGRPWTSLL